MTLETSNPAAALLERNRLRAENTRLRRALLKNTKDLKRLVKAWRDYAGGHYCSTYNREMAHGLNNAANDLEAHINQIQLPTGENE